MYSFLSGLPFRKKFHIQLINIYLNHHSFSFDMAFWFASWFDMFFLLLLWHLSLFSITFRGHSVCHSHLKLTFIWTNEIIRKSASHENNNNMLKSMCVRERERMTIEQLQSREVRENANERNKREIKWDCIWTNSR